MPVATADQYRAFRRRRAGAVLIEIAAVLLAVFLLGQALRCACFRCPVCGAALPRRGRSVKPSEFFKGHCPHCQTRFVR